MDFIKPLYVVKGRQPQREPARPLTAEERVAGWYESETYSGEQIVVNLGHEAEDSATYLLTWSPEPGDQIVASVDVTFCRRSAYYRPVIQDKQRRYYHLRATRYMPDAYDALERQVSAAMDNIWVPKTCACKIIPLGPDENLPTQCWVTNRPTPRDCKGGSP